jgi:hypothetical protein
MPGRKLRACPPAPAVFLRAAVELAVFGFQDSSAARCVTRSKGSGLGHPQLPRVRGLTGLGAASCSPGSGACSRSLSLGSWTHRPYIDKLRLTFRSSFSALPSDVRRKAFDTLLVLVQGLRPTEARCLKSPRLRRLMCRTPPDFGRIIDSPRGCAGKSELLISALP